MLTPLLYKDTHDGLTDIYRKVAPGTHLHSVLCEYMLTRGLEFVALTVPTVRPSEFVVKNLSRFSQKFPQEYTDNLDALLAQGGDDPRVLVINCQSKSAQLVKVDSLQKYNETLLSLFVQSLQQINKTSRVLYRMVGQVPKHGLGKFVSSETNQCCFKNLVCKLKANRGGFEIKLYVRGHLNHNSLLDLSTVSKWFNCEPTLVFT